MAQRKKISPAEKVTFTKGKIDAFQCSKGKTRSYLWDIDIKGLGVIATAGGTKSFIFQAKIHGKSARLTIGNVNTWSISDAKAEARRLQVQIDKGYDPREVKAEAEESKKRTAAILKEKETRESINLAMAWNDYIAARKPYWSERHYNDHIKVIHSGGESRARRKEPTIPGELASLANDKLVDITSARLIDWAHKEASTRPARARLALRLLSAFLNWCMSHDTYQQAITTNEAQHKTIREILGRPKVKNDVLQREQLPAWFNAVRQLYNPVISAYLQALMLTGARREEIARLRWEDIDFPWNGLTIRDKVEGLRIIPLTPYVAHLLVNLPRRNQWVFSSPTAASGRLTEPRIAHNRALSIAGLPPLTLHGLRRTFASLCEWVEMPAGIAAQIQGHKPQGVREQNYVRRPLDLLRMWHVKIEAWILEQAKVEFIPEKIGLHSVTST
ncbi:MAG: prophage integrase IntF [Nitrosomonas sp.]|nr:MAG: prophage integrase IntF [Nitrosomonas sp.]